MKFVPKASLLPAGPWRLAVRRDPSTHGQTSVSISPEMDLLLAEGQPTVVRKGLCLHALLIRVNREQVVFPNSRAFLDDTGLATFNDTTVPAWWFGRDSTLLFNGPGAMIPNSS